MEEAELLLSPFRGPALVSEKQTDALNRYRTTNEDLGGCGLPWQATSCLSRKQLNRGASYNPLRRQGNMSGRT
jgi:hypothetical protein